jgi:signal transduction histidine kinase
MKKDEIKEFNDRIDRLEKFLKRASNETKAEKERLSEVLKERAVYEDYYKRFGRESI